MKELPYEDRQKLFPTTAYNQGWEYSVANFFCERCHTYCIKRYKRKTLSTLHTQELCWVKHCINLCKEGASKELFLHEGPIFLGPISVQEKSDIRMELMFPGVVSGYKLMLG